MHQIKNYFLKNLVAKSLVLFSIFFAKAKGIFAEKIIRTTIGFLILSQFNFAIAQTAPNALPTGGRVVAGNATISQTQNANSASMNINQTSQRAVVNWDSFNVGKNATVNFNQPNSSAVTLNRVTGVTQSMVEGVVNANGQVVLVNPNGVTISKGGEINAAGVVATTMDIGNKDFMDGKSTYKGNGKGAVVNEGKISTNDPNGYIALLAPEVRNEGYLLAKKGPDNTVALASGKQVTLDFRGDHLISVNVDRSVYQGLIENKRIIEVPGGLVVVAAGAANKLMASVVKNTGRISASSAVNNGGVIELVANTVTQAGVVAANGNGQSNVGGQVNIVGENINLAAGSKTTARGNVGGGQVNVGLAATSVAGGTQVNAVAPSQLTNAQAQAIIKTNANTAAANNQLAKVITIAQSAVVDASATQFGNGGIIAIWSQVQTNLAGILKSMGGALSGNGGFVETSSKGSVILTPTAVINTSALKGNAGTWLLDPIDLTIDPSTANVISLALQENNVNIAVAGNNCPSLGACTQAGNGNLTIASGASILKQGNALTTLTLNASGIFNLNADISGQNLNVIINSSIAYLNVGTTITVNQVTVQAQTIYANGTINTYASNSNSPLSSAISLLAQALFINGTLNAGSSTNTPANTSTNTSVTYNGITLRKQDLPTFLAGQNSVASSATALDRVYSTTAANDPNATVAPALSIAAQAIQAQYHTQLVNQGYSNIAANQSAGNVIQLQATNSIAIANTAQVLANGTTGGQIYLSAPSIATQSGSILQANGNNGPGGIIAIAGSQLNLNGTIAANGNDGGLITMTAASGVLTLGATVQANGSNGRGGTIQALQASDIEINSAIIQANGQTDGGSITLVADTGNFNFANSLVQTNGAAGRGGSINLSANNGSLDISSTLGSSGASQGGNIFLTANNITLENNSIITATGNTGGGSVLIGGDMHGSNGIYQATNVAMSVGAVIDASALVNGDGGKVVLWADINNPNSYTQVHGSIYARGGAIGGVGGSVETSAANVNTQNALVDLRAFDGSAGTWLVDPNNYVFGSNGAADIVSALNTSNLTISTSAATSIRTDNSGNCSTCGDMIFNNAILYSGSNPRTLTLQSNGYINISANITSSNAALNVILWSDSGGIGGTAGGSGGYIYIAPGVQILSHGGDIVLGGGVDNGAGRPSSYAWNANNNTSAGVMLGAIGGSGATVALISSGGNISISGKTSGSSTYPGITSQASVLIDSGAGTITMNGLSSTGHGVELGFGNNTANIVITSASTSANAIVISATTTATGYQGFWATNNSVSSTQGVLIQATGSGGGGIAYWLSHNWRWSFIERY